MAKYKPVVSPEISSRWWHVINRYGGDFSCWWHFRDLYTLALQGIRTISSNRAGRSFTVTKEGNVITSMVTSEKGEEADGRKNRRAEGSGE